MITATMNNVNVYRDRLETQGRETKLEKLKGIGKKLTSLLQ